MAGLDNANADLLGAAVCTALGVSDAGAIAKWKTIARTFYAHLKTDVVIVIQVGSIHTTGTAAAQAGPTPTPVSITPE